MKDQHPEEWLPISSMEVGTYYTCNGRNLGVGMWNGKGFVYTRSKFGSTFTDIEFHYDEGAPYGTCKPIETIAKDIA